jgi:Protein of unknown function (DUF1579)
MSLGFAAGSMKTLPVLWLPLCCVLFANCATLDARENMTTDEPVTLPTPATATAEHQWLGRLVGEWDVVSEASMGPDQPPFRMESTESVRQIGDLWVQGEGRAMYEGRPFTSILTLGYDPRERVFVGSWIDTVQTHQWTYRGRLDAARRVLSLEAEGPSLEDPTRMARYRDAFEIAGPDRKVLTSSIQQADGTWMPFARAEFRRRK